MKKFQRLLDWKKIDWPLLIFLIGFLNVKLIVKIIALAFILVYTRDFRFGFRARHSRLPPFYLLILGPECLKYVFVTRNFSLNYALVFGLGVLQWLLCILAVHQVRRSVDQGGPVLADQTIRVFFLLNFLFSLFFLALLLFHPAWLTFWGHPADIRFADTSAGDCILGISFDTSTLNATLNSLGLIYFLFKRQWAFVLICLLTVGLCTSNATFIILMGILGLMAISASSRFLKLASLLTLLTTGLLYFSMSRSNRAYIRNYFIQLYVKNKPSYIVDTVAAAAVRPKLLPLPSGDTYLRISAQDYLTKPGKYLSFIQTLAYLRMNPRNFVLGAGMGNFSSKLAFRASGVGALGTYPRRFGYIAPEFRYNHLYTYLFYFNSDPSEHSVLNYPFSVYNQIFGEYGFLGAACLALGYFGYFLARFHRLSYGRYLLLLLAGFFLMEYWFELLSLVVVFELFMFLNIAEGKNPPLPSG